MLEDWHFLATYRVRQISFENDYIVPAIQQILNKFNQTLGVRGLRREIFVIDDDVTVSIDCFEIDGFGERAHDEEEEEDRQDPQCRNNKLASLLWYFDVDTLFITDTILGGCG